ncbi:hypothetical protein INT44_007822, partial [Umbelopsis vinacea]
MRFYRTRSRRSLFAAFLCIVAAVLVFLCLFSCNSPSMLRIYFLKFTSGAIEVYYGWRYHCIVQAGQTACYFDNVILYPIDTFTANLFNATYPQMFADQITMDPDTQPLFTATPLHNPQIVAAAFLCLICSISAPLVAIARVTTKKVEDKAYARGFLALLGAALAMILLTLVSMLYDNGQQILNLEFPHIQAETGNGKSIVGITFGLLFAASALLLRGCFEETDS